MNPRKNTPVPLTTAAVTNLSENGNTELPPDSTIPEVQDFIKARERLLRRRDQIQTEWQQIMELLRCLDTERPNAPEKPLLRKARRGRGRPAGKLADAIAAELAAGPLSKSDLIQRLQDRSFRFNGNPRRQLDSVIYSKRFQRAGNLFSNAAAGEPATI